MTDVVAFIHTYARDRELGSFMTELVEGFRAAGVRLHLMVTNDLVHNLGARALKASIDEDKLVGYINRIRPAFIFTTNRGGVTRGILERTDCPIVTWMVDRIPFLHHGGNHKDLFCERDHVITSSHKNVDRLEQIYPVLRGRVHYLPFATNVNDFAGVAPAQDTNIVFVGTYFHAGLLTSILEKSRARPDLCRAIMAATADIEADYDLDIDKCIQRHGLQNLLTDFNIDGYRFKGLVANAVSLNRRIKVLDAVSDLGLVLYGTENWVEVSDYSLQLLRCYRFGQFIKTRSQLVNSYQRSKIALNVSHHQAVDGLPYRIYDIMASRALLVTNWQRDSDLYRLFGKDMPVPIYRDEYELRSLVKHFLSHEEERAEIVARCNELVREGFSFEDRVRDFLRIAGVVEKSEAESNGFQRVSIKDLRRGPIQMVVYLLKNPRNIGVYLAQYVASLMPVADRLYMGLLVRRLMPAAIRDWLLGRARG